MAPERASAAEAQRRAEDILCLQSLWGDMETRKLFTRCLSRKGKILIRQGVRRFATGAPHSRLYVLGSPYFRAEKDASPRSIRSRPNSNRPSGPPVSNIGSASATRFGN